MSVRRTSKLVYQTIKDNGLLSKMRWKTYRALFKHGPCTGSELYTFMDWSGVGLVRSNVRGRLFELRDMGAVYEVQLRPCRETGMTVIEWDVTDKLPTKMPPRRVVRHCACCRHRHGFVMGA